MSVTITPDNFPDPVFRDYVKNNYDSDKDSLLSDDEIDRAVSLDLVQAGVTTFAGIQYLTELRNININNNYNVTSLNVNALTHLSSLNCDFLAITSLNLNSNTQLEVLSLRGCSSLTSLNLGNNTSLRFLDLTGCTEIPNIDISQLNNLERLIISDIGRTSLDLTGKTLLEVLIIDGNPIQNIDLTPCPNLVEFEAAGMPNLVNVTGIYGCQDLEIIRFDSSPNVGFTTIDLSKFQSLKWFYANGAVNLQTITIDNPALERLLIKETSIQAVDLSSCTKLEQIYASNCPNITEIDLTSCPDLVIANFARDSALDSLVIGEKEKLRYLECVGTDLDSINIQGAPLIIDVYNNVAPTTGTIEGKGCKQHYQKVGGYLFSYNDDTAILTETIAPPMITRHPQSATVTEGNTVSFLASASGTSPVYQWQRSTDDGETWTDIRGATGTTYQTTAALTMDGTQYRCQVSNTVGTVYSNAATLTVEADTSIQLPVITQQPQSATVNEGNSATFTVTATGDDLHYQWQGNNTGTWFNITGETNASYTIAGTLGTSGMLFRCIVSNDAGAARSEEAMITVNPVTNVQTPIISYNPSDVTVQEGNTASFRVVAQGGDLAYQWQVNRDGSWYNITDATSASYSFKAALTDNGTYYRCLVSNSAGSVYSSGALLTVTAKPDVTPNQPTKINKYFLINGYDILPFIKDRGIKWSRNDVDGDNAGRVLGNANMQRDRLAIKVRCDIECRPLGTAEIQRLLAAIEPVFVTVQQNIDPRIGTSTRVMYSNNATVVIGTVYDDENDLYEDLTFPLIEQ